MVDKPDEADKLIGEGRTNNDAGRKPVASNTDTLVLHPRLGARQVQDM